MPGRFAQAKFLAPDIPFRVLGFFMSLDAPRCQTYWDDLVRKVQKAASKLHLHHLSLRTRVRVIRVKLLSLILYPLWLDPPPNRIALQLDKIMWICLWLGKQRGWINRNYATQEIVQGGLDFPSVNAMA